MVATHNGARRAGGLDSTAINPTWDASPAPDQTTLPLTIPGSEPVLVTIKEAARMLSLSRSTVYELIAEGRLEVVHIGRSSRVPVDAILQLVLDLRARTSLTADS
jgi:excisionase family DNA binding protein